MANKLRIGKREIGAGNPPFVIPEIGINHEGSLKKAKFMIMRASQSGAECVKFQCHIVEDEMVKNDVIPGNASVSIWEIMVRCSLTEDEEIVLKDYTESLGMIFLSTPFSRAAADRLESMGVLAYKIGSGECNNYPLIEHISSFGKPVILSTGMNDIESIRKAVDILERKHIEYALMHCTSMYPTPYNFVRLGAIQELSREYPNAVIGLSDHSIGNYTCFAAIPLGARILEKHFTADKRWKGPDMPISIDPRGLEDLIRGSNSIFLSLGGEKKILSEERPTIDFAYACVVSIDEIRKGDVFTRDNLWVKRPGTGEIKAVEYDNVLGKRATVDIERDCQISRAMIE